MTTRDARSPLAQEAFRHVCHSMGTGMFKDKPLYEFLKRTRAAVAASGEPPVGWITMKKENATMLLGTTLVIFRCGRPSVSAPSLASLPVSACPLATYQKLG